MNTKEVLNKADQLFDEGKANDAVAYMEKCVRTAYRTGDWQTELTLLNELMGYYRSRSDLSMAWKLADRAEKLMKDHELMGTLNGATTSLNIANVFRAAGHPDGAYHIYEQIEKTYLSKGMILDNRLGGLYNNMMVAALEMGNQKMALMYGDKAIHTLKQIPELADECATVCSNLAGVCLKLPVPDIDKAVYYLKKGEGLFLTRCDGSPHYGANLAMHAVLCYRTGDYEGSLKYYKKSLVEIEKFYGRNKDYERISQNIEEVYSLIRKQEG